MMLNKYVLEDILTLIHNRESLINIQKVFLCIHSYVIRRVYTEEDWENIAFTQIVTDEFFLEFKDEIELAFYGPMPKLTESDKTECIF